MPGSCGGNAPIQGAGVIRGDPGGEIRLLAMTAFELCRQRSEFELAPVLRVVKYLALDSTHLDASGIERIAKLYPHFRNDPELVIGLERAAARVGVDAETLRDLLRQHRGEVPFLGTPDRPMIPLVGVEMLQHMVGGDTETALAEPDEDEQVVELQREIDAALEQVRSLGRTLSKLSRRVQQHSLPGDSPRHRRSGGGRPDTIVEACRKVLEQSAGPMKVADITERVVSQGIEIKAKNPNVTVSSILSSYEAFARVRRGYYTLAPAARTQ